MELAFFVRGSMPRTFSQTGGTMMQKEKQKASTQSESRAIMKKNSDRFFGQKQLKGVTILDSVTQIGTSTFFNCTGLTELIIPPSVTVIEGYAFKSCTGLSHITIPKSVGLIEWYAFEACENLTYIIYRGTMKEWKAIPKGVNWDSDTGNYTIVCTDGTIPKR